MALPTSLTAGTWSGLSVHIADTVSVDETVQANLEAGFATVDTTHADIPNLREFPSIGTPSNLVNVPQYGQSITSQVQGQADAPSLDFTINYVPSLWAAGTTLGDLVGDGTARMFQLYICSSEPPSSVATTSALGSVPNAVWYFPGKIEALLIDNNLTDAVTATLTLSLPTGTFLGPYTVATV